MTPVSCVSPLRRAAQDGGVSVVLAVVMLGPLLVGSGYWLFGDMVFVPRQPWKDAWLGLDGSLPRSVPMDALVSMLTYVVPGEWVQRTFLLGALVLGGLGMGRLVHRYAWYARTAAITFFLWNPWVHEHLLIGQWAILAGYLALPWVALAARRLRRDVRAGWAPVAVALAASAVCSPSSGVMAVVVLAVLGLRRSLGSWLTVAALGVVANLPWLLPSIVASRSMGSTVSTDGVFDSFAARGESTLGLLPSLTSMGGIWKTSILAPERTSGTIVALSCLLTLVALLGLRHIARRHEVGRLACLAALGLVVAILPTVAAGAATLEAVADVVPATALLRDSHRFLAPAALLIAVGLAGALTWLGARVATGREAIWALVGLAIVAPVLLLPSLAWGGGELEGSTYPADFETVAELIGDQPEATTIVLPWAGSYRRFDWNDERAVLDPAPRYFSGEVLIDDRTYVDDEVIASEDPRVGEVSDALELPGAGLRAAALRELGVRWVVLEAGQSPPVEVAASAVYQGPDLSLFDLAVKSDSRSVTAPSHDDYAALVLTGNACWLLLLAVALVRIMRLGVTTVTSQRRSSRGLWEGTEQ